EKRIVSEEEIIRQKHFMAQVKSMIHVGARAMVDTYGCQQNEADSEILRGMLTEMGYAMTDDTAQADVVVVNTCAVREHAELRVLGNVGALTHTKHNRPGQIIAICGCMAQREGVAEKIKKSYRHVNMVFGTHALYRFPELLFKALTTDKRVFDVTDTDGCVVEGLPLARDSRIKAWVSIMYGCNNFCSYCIVPYVRGRERSRRSGAIIEEIGALIASGTRDITLLGQNVNSYGRDLDENVDFSELLIKINAIPGEFTVRFMTSHPKDATPRLFETMKKCEKVSRHIHLPFQSGSDKILSDMNRGYTRAQYIETIRAARALMPEIVFSSDVIVGFPSETARDFDETLSLVAEVKFDALFTFIYSKRPGTRAAEMDDVTTREEKQVRFDKLLALQNGIARDYAQVMRGSVLRVLVEEELGGELNLAARTDSNRPVRFAGGAELVGTFVSVKIDKCTKRTMEATLVI
ncbi:MAG: tRNA (N6-isopentenyl adenosine(37)-C2)-methylthiotransferase MiaB, partial [Clostridia bacterium]